MAVTDSIVLEMCMGMGFPVGMGIPWEWEWKADFCRNGNDFRRSGNVGKCIRKKIQI